MEKTDFPIRVRVNVAVVKDEKTLLVPHFLDNNKTAWYIPGGKVEFGEKLIETARREFKEETGFSVKVGKLIDIFELIEPEKPWHSIALTYKGKIIGGRLKAEKHSRYGVKTPKWFSFDELKGFDYRPPTAVKKLFKET